MRIRLILAMLIAVSALAAPSVAHATWVGNKCYDNHASVTYWKRIDSRTYADVAVGEGYEWGGGCWNNNNRDDTPLDGDTQSSDGNSGGEGPDCSGFTFKTWKLLPTVGANGGRWYSQWENIHGPYASGSFASLGVPSTWPFHVIVDANGNPTKNKSRLIYMDAYAHDGHIGMIYSVYSSANTDMIIEAVGRPRNPPVGKFEEDYAADSRYVAVRREAWTPDCYPRCPAAAETTGRERTDSVGSVVVVP
jgi:hypothetical protein